MVLLDASSSDSESESETVLVTEASSSAAAKAPAAASAAAHAPAEDVCSLASSTLEPTSSEECMIAGASPRQPSSAEEGEWRAAFGRPAPLDETEEARPWKTPRQEGGGSSSSSLPLVLAGGRPAEQAVVDITIESRRRTMEAEYDANQGISPSVLLQHYKKARKIAHPEA